VFKPSFLAYAVASDPNSPSWFAVTVCHRHPVASNETLLDTALGGITARQTAYEALHNPAPLPGQPVVSPPEAPPRAAPKTPVPALPLELPPPATQANPVTSWIQRFQRHRTQSSHPRSPPPVLVTRQVLTLSQGIRALMGASPSRPKAPSKAGTQTTRGRGGHTPEPPLSTKDPPQPVSTATPLLARPTLVPPRPRSSTARLWYISRAVLAYFNMSQSGKKQRRTTLHNLLRSTPHHPPPTPLPWRSPWLSLPIFFQCLWNLSTATPQVSPPCILGLTSLAPIQYELPRIHPTTRSSTWSSVSYGLRWLIALHDKAIASAWDLVTQTHLELWGQGNDGHRIVASSSLLPQHLTIAHLFVPFL
jgi:hypothetical protein